MSEGAWRNWCRVLVNWNCGGEGGGDNLVHVGGNVVLHHGGLIRFGQKEYGI